MRRPSKYSLKDIPDDERTLPVYVSIVCQNGLELKYIENQTYYIIWLAVKQNGMALQYAKQQTAHICLEAFNQTVEAIKFIDFKYQTKEMCLQAVKTDGVLIEYAKYKTEDICWIAIKNNVFALAFMKPTLLMVFWGLRKTSYAVHCIYKINMRLSKVIVEDQYYLPYLRQQTVQSDRCKKSRGDTTPEMFMF
jgi:hypothetical protein